MKIGLDFDEVIGEFLEQALRFYHLKTGRKIEKKDFFSYDFWEVWGGTREEAIQMVQEFYDSDLFEGINPVERAIESVNYLLDKNKIFIITSRPSWWKEKTDNWIKKHLKNAPIKLIYSGDFHGGQKKTKIDICKELGIKLMIEDSAKYALDCANSEIKVILFDKPWNKGIEHKNITRVYNWIEAIKETDKIVQKTALVK